MSELKKDIDENPFMRMQLDIVHNGINEVFPSKQEVDIRQILSTSKYVDIGVAKLYESEPPRTQLFYATDKLILPDNKVQKLGYYIFLSDSIPNKEYGWRSDDYVATMKAMTAHIKEGFSETGFEDTALIMLHAKMPKGFNIIPHVKAGNKDRWTERTYMVGGGQLVKALNGIVRSFDLAKKFPVELHTEFKVEETAEGIKAAVEDFKKVKTDQYLKNQDGEG
jgi:hypothetical protein